MELIKTINPNTSIMEDTLTEAQCNELLSSINENLSSDGPITRPVMELSDTAALGVTYAAAAVLLTIAAITKWIKNKYRLTVKKMIDQSKELNDIYVKVDDLLKNDKMARFKHRNDKVDTYFKYAVLKDKNDPRKFYQATIDYLAYDPQYFIDEINSIMKYVENESKNKKADLDNMKKSLMDKIDQGFKENHGFVEFCEPLMKIETIRGIRMEDAITRFKTYVSNIYETLYIFDKYMASELQYMQALEKAYGRMVSLYAKNPDAKKMIDEIFKKLLKNVGMSLDFNSKMMTIFSEEIKWYAEELKRFYEIIKQ